MIELGETFSSTTFKITDSAGAPGAATVTCAVTLPDQTTVAPTVTTPALGSYVFDYTPTVQPGRHAFVVTATGGVLGSLIRKFADTFDVRPADPGLIVSLEAAKKHLNIPAAKTGDDDELLGWLESITRLVESKAGEVTRKTFTERHSGGRGSLWLRHPPVISVTSIGPWLGSGTSYATADVRATESGRVELLSGACFPRGPFAVTYVAGQSSVPANLREATKIILKHLWETQRGAAALPLQAADETSMIPGFGFAIPNRAIELMAPDLLSGNYA